MKNTGFAASTSQALTAGVWAAIPVGVTPSVDNQSGPFPQAGWIDRVELRLVHPSGLTARTMDCILSHDAAGSYGASNQRQEPVSPMPATGPNTGVAVFSVAGFFPQTQNSVTDTIYVWVLLSGVGAYTAEARVYFDEQTP